MRIEIITAGGEILTGRTLDTNFRYLARRLAALGAPPLWHTTVPDSRELMAEAVRSAIGRAEGVVITGGLGGTPDDVTRRVLSQVLERQLVLREEVLREVEGRYRARGRRPTAASQGIALVPQGARLVPNPVGLAPGLFLETPRGSWVCALPGVPEEMEAMAEQSVLPFIERRLGGARGWEVILRTTGVPETILAEWIGGETPAGCDVAYLATWTGVDLRLIRRPGPGPDRPTYDLWAAEIEARLGGAVWGYGETSPEESVGAALLEIGRRFASAESVTGGGVGGAMTRVPGASRYYLGSVVAYDNEAKQRILGVGRGTLLNHGAVSAPVAEAMAAGARRIFGADFAVATTGIAGPTGGSPEKPVGLVWFGLSSPEGDVSVARRFPATNREAITGRATATALLLALRRLRGQPLEDPTGPAGGGGPVEGGVPDA